MGRASLSWIVAASALWLCACGRAPEPAKTLSPETKAETPPPVQQQSAWQEITIHVPGMIDRQGIT